MSETTPTWPIETPAQQAAALIERAARSHEARQQIKRILEDPDHPLFAEVLIQATAVVEHRPEPPLN